MPLATIDLFAGVGGFTVGLRRARGKAANLFDVRLLVDSDPAAAQTFRMNFPSSNYLVADVMDLNAEAILRKAKLRRGGLGALVGGPPCQGFSSAGKRAIDHPKNALAKQFLRLAVNLRPRIILMENVPQLINWNDGQLYSEIQRLLNRGGYYARCQVLGAQTFGVPQLRRRAILVAIRKALVDGPPEFPVSNGSTLHKARHTIPAKGGLGLDVASTGFLSVETAIGDLPPLRSGERASQYHREPYTDYQKARRAGAQFLFNHEARGHSKEFLSGKITKIGPGGSNKDLPARKRFDRNNDDQYFSQAYGRLHADMIAQTITTNFMNPGSGRFTHYRDHRSITVREAARIQSFDDSFIFYGDLGDQQRHVGNAVPPLMSRAIGEWFGPPAAA